MRMYETGCVRRMRCICLVILVQAIISLVFALILILGPDQPFDCENDNHQSSQPFPRQIHQIRISSEPSTQLEPYQEECLKMNPGYNLTMWHDADIENLLTEHYAWFLDTYYSYPYTVMRADAARYFILHHVGGIYMDLDVKCKKPFDLMLDANQDFGAILVTTSLLGISNNFFIAGKAGHPFLTMLTQGLPGSFQQHFTVYFTVMLSTGPFYVYQTYHSYPCHLQHVTIVQKQHHRPIMEHHGTADWLGSEQAFFQWIDHHGKICLTMLFLALILLVLFVRRYALSIGSVSKRNVSCMSNGSISKKNVSWMSNGYISKTNMSFMSNGSISKTNGSCMSNGYISRTNVPFMSNGSIPKTSVPCVSNGSIPKTNLSCMSNGSIPKTNLSCVTNI